MDMESVEAGHEDHLFPLLLRQLADAIIRFSAQVQADPFEARVVQDGRNRVLGKQHLHFLYACATGGPYELPAMQADHPQGVDQRIAVIEWKSHIRYDADDEITQPLLVSIDAGSAIQGVRIPFGDDIGLIRDALGQQVLKRFNDRGGIMEYKGDSYIVINFSAQNGFGGYNRDTYSFKFEVGCVCQRKSVAKGLPKSEHLPTPQ